MKLRSSRVATLLAAALLLSATSNAWCGTNTLASLKPLAAEYGLMPAASDGKPVDIPGRTDPGTYVDGSGFWPGNWKIVPVIPPTSTYPTNASYSSTWTNVFMVSHYPVAGVGLWVKNPNGYHWVEFALPQQSRRFVGSAFMTDDVLGYARGYRHKTNQQGELIITVDGREVYRKEFTRTDLEPDSGGIVAEIDVELPANGKAIRFRLELSGWGDGNTNAELVLMDAGVVTPGR